MNLTTHSKFALCLPKDISPEVFLSEYWQKKPLLIKNGLPALVGMFEPDDVLGLALEEEVSARLIKEFKDPQGSQWQLKPSPLSQSDFDNLPKHWTVLVQNLEQWSGELGELWRAFDFIPKWQQDDIMVSYAPDGGSVGEHFDEYDVFLAQGYGKRRWQLGKMCPSDTPFIPNQPIRLLDDMGEIIFDEVLEAGDVLYVPPRLSHYGVAVGDCLTFSFGFRRPNLVQILDKVADVATNDPSLFVPLQLPQAYQDGAFEFSHESISSLKSALIDALQSGRMDGIITQALSELVSRRQYEALSFYDEFDVDMLTEALKNGAMLSINHASRFVLVGDEWYINGEKVCFDTTAENLLKRFLKGEVMGADDLDTIDETLCAWINNNWLSVDMDEPDFDDE